jgi:hypothetical protein
MIDRLPLPLAQLTQFELHKAINGSPQHLLHSNQRTAKDLLDHHHIVITSYRIRIDLKQRHNAARRGGGLTSSKIRMADHNRVPQ